MTGFELLAREVLHAGNPRSVCVDGPTVALMRVFLTLLGYSCKTRPLGWWVPGEVPPTIKLGLIRRVKSGVLLEQDEGEDPLGVGFVRWGDLYALEVMSPRLAHITSNRARSSVMSSSRVQEPLDECRDCKLGGEAKSSLVDSRDWKLLGEAESSLVDSRDWKPLDEAESSLVNSETESSLVDSRNWKSLGKAESSLCRYLDGAQNDRARLEGDVLSLTEAAALLKVELKAEGQNAVATHKASRRFESSLEKMGRVSYEFRYRVTLERL
ncbi:hypothetical protein B296_00048723 [Ensete ventricosum]|uniref:Uncharacterized protein n=1 Tax=Ensete ventricosum TaxID=4639 RepID=A0A426YTN2_ENSVE|nr:hypothetical protein B296_00048723 [Ensete ventricosum]